jgi:hypothetical protein
MRDGQNPRPRTRPLVLACGLLLLGAQAGGAVADSHFKRVYASSSKQALTDWGRRYQHGEGVPRDLDKAVRLYCKAAQKGDVEAQYFLGYLYANGTGVPRDEELAAAWLHLAAAKQDAHSKRILARLGYGKRPKRKAECVLPDGGDAQRPAARLTSLGRTRAHPARGEIASLARALAADYKLDPNLVLAVIEVESNFNPRARSPKNAQGLMQLIPATAERFGVRDVWDPEQNMRGGMAYLRWLLREFNGDVRLALAGYNAGEGAVQKHGGVPPYRETQAYVSRILAKLAP